MRKKLLLTSTAILFMLQPLTAFAVTEDEVLAVGKETATGNVFIWFLCAIAFLKISQKIDSFMASLGINVGQTGGSMLSELLVAAKGISSIRNITGGSSFSSNISSRSHGMNQAPLAGGLAGIVGRQFIQNTMTTMTGQTNNVLGRKAFENSLKKGGDFANNITGAVAQGNISQIGTMTGVQAAEALTSYLGQTGMDNAPTYNGVEIGGGRIMGTEISTEHPNGTAFAMYHADQYLAPEGAYETVTAADNSTWYKQYATDSVERIPYMNETGEIAYHESIVKKLPDIPRRKDRI